MGDPKLNVFFDVDFTILSIEGDLRNGTREAFTKLVADGHRVFIWSGVGMRTDEIHANGLHDLVSGIYVKPIEDFEAGLRQFEVNVHPDLVVDDMWPIVNNFGGIHCMPFYYPSETDREMELIYQLIDEYARVGHANHPSFLRGKIWEQA